MNNQILRSSANWEDPLEEGMASTLVFLPGEPLGQRSLVGYSPRDRRELDTTEHLSAQTQQIKRKGTGVGVKNFKFSLWNSCLWPLIIH